MKEIINTIKNINDEVKSILKESSEMLTILDKEHPEMSAKLKAEHSQNLVERVKYTWVLVYGFQKRLAETGKENKRVAQKLQKDLANGEMRGIGDYNGILKGIYAVTKGIRVEVKEVQKTTSGILENYSNDLESTANEWDIKQKSIDQIRKTEVIERPKAVEINVLKAEIIAEPIMEAQVNAQPKEIPRLVAPLTLKKKVLDIINKHPNGLRISEMEQPLGETRMKLGFIAKSLLEEGKIQKLENIYFPIK
jgi:hypothetical protein